MSFSLAPRPRLAIPEWWPDTKKTWRGDVIGGITLWGLVVPESIAYAGLAGLPATSGVWAIVFILPIYALWGRSRHLVASPTSAIAVTTGGMIATFSTSDPRQAAAIITMTVGIVFLLAYLFKLGFIVNFISEPINAGFMLGIAVFVVISQLSKMLGIEGGHGTALERLWVVITKLGTINWWTVGVTGLAAALMLAIPRVSKKIPAGLFMIVVTSLVVGLLHLAKDHHVKTAGAIPTGFPHPVKPSLGHGDLVLLIVGAVGVVLVAFSEASGVARAMAEARGEEYDADRDLFPMGLGNVISGVFGGLAGAGSMTSSSENDASGAKTQLSTIVTAIAALLTAMFFGKATENLAEAALGVLIIFAVRNHLTLRQVNRIRRYNPTEAVIAILAALGVLVLGVLPGLLIAMASSLIWYIYSTSRIRAFNLGVSSHKPPILVTSQAKDFHPLPEGVLGFRFQGDIFYGNVTSATDVIDKATMHPKEPVRAVLIDIEHTGFADYTSVGDVIELAHRLQKRHIWMVFIGVGEQFKDHIARLDAMPDNVVIVHDDFHPGTLEAIAAKGVHKSADATPAKSAE